MSNHKRMSSLVKLMLVDTVLACSHYQDVVSRSCDNIHMCALTYQHLLLLMTYVKRK